MTPEQILDDTISRHPKLTGIRRDIEAVYRELVRCFDAGGRLYVCGNGGSAADALHIVGELMKSFVLARPADDRFAARLKELYPESAVTMLKNLQGALPAYALVENSALSLAYCNDVCAEMVFAQQVYGYAGPDDVLLGISTSGNAVNIANAVRVAKAKGLVTIALTGGTGGALARLCDHTLVMPETETYKIQELHLPVYHALCLMIEQHFFGRA